MVIEEPVAMTENASKVFLTAENHLRQLCDHLKDGEKINHTPEIFRIQEFWLQLEIGIKDVSQVCTQIAMAFTRTPFPNAKESQDLMNSIEAAANNLASIFHSLPKEQGRYLYNDVHKLVLKIIKSLPEFVLSLDNKGAKGTRGRLKNAGLVFVACEEYEKLPKNNLDSTLNFLHTEEMLLLDALQEIDEEVKNDFSAQKSGEEIDNTEMWNNQDRELLPPCVGLVKTARSCLKKIILALRSQGNCMTVSNIAELDNITLIIEDLSPAVDNFVSAIYPPMNQSAVKKAARNVVNIIQNLLNQVKSCHFMKEEDQKWLNFLLKAVDHNNNKLQPLFSIERTSDCNETDASDNDSRDDEEEEGDVDDDDDDEDEDDVFTAN